VGRSSRRCRGEGLSRLYEDDFRLGAIRAKTLRSAADARKNGGKGEENSGCGRIRKKGGKGKYTREKILRVQAEAEQARTKGRGAPNEHEPDQPQAELGKE